MVETNAVYNEIYQRGKFHTEYRITVNGDSNNTYTNDDIIDGNITDILFEVLSLGNLISSRFEFSFIDDTINIPRSATLDLDFRIKDSIATSDWFPKGKFFCSYRTKGSLNLVRITAYDSSLKARTVFMPSGTWTQTTALALYTEICTKLSINQHTATVQMLTNEPNTISQAPDIGENGSTFKDILAWIGTLYGGNWRVNEYNELQFIAFDSGQTNSNNFEVISVFASPEVTVDRLIISNNDTRTNLRYPDVTDSQWESMTGYIIKGNSRYVTEDNIQSVAQKVIGKTYVGYEIIGMQENPAIQLGDSFNTINGEQKLVVVKRSNSLNGNVEYTSPYEEEAENEYQIPDPIMRDIEKSESRMQASITVVDDRITSVVEEFNEETGLLQTQINQTVDGIEAVTKREDEQESYLRWDGSTSTLSIGESSSPTVAKVNPNGFSVVQNGEEILTAKNQKVSTKRLEATETLTVGRYQWLDEDIKGYSLIYLKEE